MPAAIAHVIVKRLVKLKPRTELRTVAVVLIIMATMLFGSLIWTARYYRNFRDSPWSKFSSNEQIYMDFLECYRAIFFILFPAVGVIFAGTAWTILKHVRKIQNEPEAA